MYISSIPNRKSPPAVLLRESFRENGKVKNRTLANLSHWNPARIEALRRALRGDFDHVEPCEAALGPVFGMLYVLKQIADALGIAGVFGNTRLAKLGLFLILARVAHQGSRLSAVRWAADHAVSEVLGLGSFDEDDLYAALDDLCARQEKMEQALFRLYLRRKAAPPRLFLYDVTSSYLEGEQNELGEFGYNRDGKKGKLQIVIGLLTDAEGEPLAVRVFAGNTADPVTVVDQIKILQEQFQVQEFVFVGDRGMVKSKGIQALEKANLHYITALTDPQIRSLLGQKILQLELFSEQICEVEGAGVRYVLRKNEKEAARERHRLEDKLEKLKEKIAARNEQVKNKPRCRPEAGQRQLQAWAERHKLTGLVELPAGRPHASVAAPRGKDRKGFRVGRLLRGDHERFENEPERATGARQLRQPTTRGTRLSGPKDGLAGSAPSVCAQRESHARPRVLQHAGTETESRNGTSAARSVRHHGQQSTHDHATRCAEGTQQPVPVAVQDR